jgi:hypothetical protein
MCSHRFTSSPGGSRSAWKSRPMKRETSSSAWANTNSPPRATTGTVFTPKASRSFMASGRAATSMDSNATPCWFKNSLTLTQLEQPGRQ